MKKIIIGFLFTIFSLALSAQKSTSFFLSLGSQMGFPVGETIIENSEFIGFQSRRDYSGPMAPDITPVRYGFGLQGGLNINDRWNISSGISYLKRIDQMAFYCHVCQFPIDPIPEKFILPSLEVPFNIRLNLNRRSTFFPFITGGLSWNWLLDQGRESAWALEYTQFEFWAYTIGGGIGLRTQKNTSFLFKIQYNQDISNRSTFPNIIFKDLSFALEGIYNFLSK